MASELNLRLDPGSTGLTIVARLRKPGGVQQGSDIAMTETVGVSGFYSASMPAAPANVYTVDFFDTGFSRLRGVGQMHWSGAEELTIEDAVEDISLLNDLSIADVQTAMSAQGFTPARAVKLDNLDATITSVLAAIAALDDLSAVQVQAAVQAGLTAQGYTSALATELDGLDPQLAAALAAIAALNDLSIVDVQAAMTAQGYTAVRAVLLDNLTPILAGVEIVRKVSANRVLVSATELHVTVFEDDALTPAFEFDISPSKLERTPA